LLRWASTNNPFYVISAGLFLVGLWLSFGVPQNAEDNWLLMGGLTAYTILLAVTAVLLIRFAKVWDDARTVLLLMVMMFLATSPTLDYLTVFDARFGGRSFPLHAILSTTLALGVTLVVSETVLRIVRLRLPILYRLPYYLIVSVFLLYPLALTPYLHVDNPRNEGIMWGLFGFPSAAGLAFLTLLPAIRRGAEYLKDNGSPWPWPLYPWTLFGMLALMVPGRSILLCYSMHLIDVADLYDMTFGPYFLVPFGMVLCVLLLEAGLTTRRAGLIGTAMALPIVLVGMAMVGHRGELIYKIFLDKFVERMGADPIYCTIVACAVFYLYAAVRRVSWAVEAMTLTLAVLAFAHPRFQDFGMVADPQPAPMIVASILLLGLGVLRRGSWRCLSGACALSLGIALVIPADSEIFAYRWPIAFHMALLSVFIVGALFDDDLARSLRVVGPLLALGICLAVMVLPARAFGTLPTWALQFYPLTMSLLLAGYGCWLWHWPTLLIAAIILLSWTGAAGWQVYRMIRTWVVGMDYLVLSLLVFGLAILVSLGKSHWFARREEPKPEERPEGATNES